MSHLTDHELLMVAFAAEASGPKDDRTMERIIAWAEQVRAEGAVLDLVVEGLIVLDWDSINEHVRYKATHAAARGEDDA